jgi:hypothetical protein
MIRAYQVSQAGMRPTNLMLGSGAGHFLRGDLTATSAKGVSVSLSWNNEFNDRELRQHLRRDHRP